MLDNERNTVGPPARSLRSFASGEDLVSAARRGRGKALLSISKYCVRLLDARRNIREIWTNHPPSLQELAESLGPEYRLIAIKRKRRPIRGEIKAIPYYGAD